MLVVAPVAAIAGQSVGGRADPWEAVGWLLTCATWSVFGLRSYRHERRSHPNRSVWTSAGGGAWGRYVVGVLTFTSLTTGAALLLLWRLAGRFLD